jgi:hypothetical protein
MVFAVMMFSFWGTNVPDESLEGWAVAKNDHAIKVKTTAFFMGRDFGNTY